MRDHLSTLVLLAWVAAVAVAAHYSILGAVDGSSFAFGWAALALVCVIRWDDDA